MASDAPSGTGPDVPRPTVIPPPRREPGTGPARAVAILCVLLAVLPAAGLAAIHLRFAPSVALFESRWIDGVFRAAGAGPAVRGRVDSVLHGYGRAMIDAPLTRAQALVAARAFEESPSAIALELLEAEAALNLSLPGLPRERAEQLRSALIDLAWGIEEGRIGPGEALAILGGKEGPAAARPVGRLRLPIEAVKDLDRLLVEEDLVAKRGLGGKGRESLLEVLPERIGKDLAASLEAAR
jgi:hypothetical protein